MTTITDFKNNVVIPYFNTGMEQFRSLWNMQKHRKNDNLFVCCSFEGQIRGIYQEGTSKPHNVSFPIDNPVVSIETIKKCTNVLLLAKSQYLVKVIEVPKVVPEEVSTMLRLEIEAQVPPEYGCVEISYRELLSTRAGYCNYEVYVARKEMLEQKLADLAGQGLEPQTILPSAVAWAALRGLHDQADIYVAVEDQSHLEVAAFNADNSLALRTINVTSGLERELGDFIRPFLIHGSSDSNPLKIGWIGRDCPSHMDNDRITFIDLAFTVQSQDNETPELNDNTLLQFCTQLLHHMKDKQNLQTANLLPKEKTIQKFQRTIHTHFIAASMIFMVSLLVIFMSLKIAIFRYQRFGTQLNQKISLIKTEGEEVGRRIDQLRAIQNARLSRNDFYDVVAGLYDATPQNDVTYSQVELTDQGGIHLRGQAQSLSQPFALPEKLEKESVFEEVLLRDAGQSKRGGGSVTEFRIDCKLKRMEFR